MKNKIKILITIFTTAVVCISGTIYAASIISAKDISFTSTKEGWNPTNVEEAINDLYDNKISQRYTMDQLYVGYDDVIAKTYPFIGTNVGNSVNGLTFNGNNSYVSLARVSNPPITYEVLFKLNNITNGEVLIGDFETGGCGIAVNSTSKLYGGCHLNGSYQNIYIENTSVNEWYHLVLTVSLNEMKLYNNGTLVSTINYNNYKSSINNTIIGVGCNFNGKNCETGVLNGTIKIFRVYKKALSNDEVVKNYHYANKLISNN